MNNRRGSILVVTLGFVLIFILLGLGAIYLGTVQNEAAEKRTASTKAFWLAEAGIQKALWEYTNNSCHGLYQKNGSASCPKATTCASCTSCGTGDKCLYATVYDSSGTIAQGDYDIVLNDTNTTIISKGWYASRPSGAISPPDQSCPSSAAKGCRMILLDGGSLFGKGIFAQGQIYLHGSSSNSVVDSYNSNNGPYDPANASQNGDIGSNGVDNNGQPIIDLGNNITIKGDANTVPGGTTGGGTVTGDVSNTNPPTFIPPVVVPASLVSMAATGNHLNSGIIGVAGETHSYKYTDTSNNVSLTVNGTVNLYLTSTSNAATINTITVTAGSSLTVYTDGKATFVNKASVNAAPTVGKPINFQFYSTYASTGPADGINIGNQLQIAGVIYAPSANIIIDNNSQSSSDLYGALVGNTIISTGNNFKLHYDESLGKPPTNPASKWYEL